MRLSIRCVFCLFTAALRTAQAQDRKPPEENPVALYKGLGAWHHPIAANRWVRRWCGRAAAAKGKRSFAKA
jgi:hypothetical protein